MTEQEIQLVVVLAGLAVTITLGDLILSLIRHRRRAGVAGRSRGEGKSLSPENGGDPECESMSSRLAAIEAAEKMP